jgi:HAD superfamily hydrolase (TIGR01509 family)
LKRAVLFDWDGTLADTRQVIVASFQQAMREVDVEVGAEFIERRIGTGGEQTIKEILQASKVPFDEALVKWLAAKKVQTEIKLSGGGVKLFPGALELLMELQGKAKVALASMNNRPVVDYLLNSTKIRDFFTVIVTVEEVSHFKPDPEIFLKTASKLQCLPADCVVVEDSIFGVQAAKGAGMDCIAVLTGVYSREELETANPGLIVDSLKEKQRILGFILRK